MFRYSGSRHSMTLVVAVAASTMGCFTDSTGSTDGIRFASITAGRQHACAVTTIGIVYCWGSNSYGQLGDGTNLDSPRPVKVGTTRRFQQVDAGNFHTCGVAEDGRVFCWGSSFQGELGRGDPRGSTNLPLGVRSMLLFRKVSAGESLSCAITVDDSGYCWGARLGPDENGNAALTPAFDPEPLGLGPLLDLSAGFEIACALTRSGSVYCWGDLAPGLVYTDGTRVTGVPTLVAPTPDLLTINTGVKHACGLATDRRVYCWGTNPAGILGDSTTTTRLLPVAVVGVDEFLSVSSDGTEHVCGVTIDNAAVCWGLNASGQLGNESPGFSATPLTVTGGHEFAAVADGSAFSCGLTTSGGVYCWGAGRLGQLGNGVLADNPAPTPLELGGI